MSDKTTDKALSRMAAPGAESIYPWVGL